MHQSVERSQSRSEPRRLPLNRFRNRFFYKQQNSLPLDNYGNEVCLLLPRNIRYRVRSGVQSTIPDSATVPVAAPTIDGVGRTWRTYLSPGPVFRDGLTGICAAVW